MLACACLAAGSAELAKLGMVFVSGHAEFFQNGGFVEVMGFHQVLKALGMIAEFGIEKSHKQMGIHGQRVSQIHRSISYVLQVLHVPALKGQIKENKKAARLIIPEEKPKNLKDISIGPPRLATREELHPHPDECKRIFLFFLRWANVLWIGESSEAVRIAGKWDTSVFCG